MKLAGAIVTDKGGRTCHDAIVARELGVPAVIGTETASKTLTTGQEVTVSCAEGETGFVYRDYWPFEIKTVDLGKLVLPNIKIMMNVGRQRMHLILPRYQILALD